MIEYFFVALAVAGIVWNAAVLHNDVKHLKKDIQDIKKDLEEIKQHLP